MANIGQLKSLGNSSSVCVLQKGYIGDRSIGHEALEIAPRAFLLFMRCLTKKKVLVLKLQGSLPYIGHAIVEDETICILPTIL